jgi:hypothetical protein
MILGGVTYVTSLLRGFKFLTTVLKIPVFCNMMPCQLVSGDMSKLLHIVDTWIPICPASYTRRL